MIVKQSDTPNIHWNRITPGRLLVVLLAVVIVLFLFERWYPKGWAVLLATASVVATSLYFLARFALAIKYHYPFQYSIRSMLIFTAIIAIAGSWMGQRIRETIKQSQALGILGDAHWKSDDFPNQLFFLKDWFGEDFFRELSDTSECDFFESNATDADLEILKRCLRLRILHIRGNSAITDAGLERLKDLKGLKYLDLRDTSITDAGLKHIEAFDELQKMELCNTRVTGAGLKHLAGLKQLRTLWIDKSPISDEGLNNIGKLTQLENLSIRNAGITDARLGFLKEMKHLRVLDLENNPITDSCFVYLKELKQLQRLDLGGTAITDNGLAQLRAFGELERLSLNYTGITDNGITFLKDLKQLSELDIYSTKMTTVGINNLGKALPDLRMNL